MKSSFQIFLVFLILSCISSCSKDSNNGTTYVSGRITEKGTQTPIEGADVVAFFQGDQSSTWLDIPPEPIAVKTDKNGEYSLQFNWNKSNTIEASIKNSEFTDAPDRAGASLGQKNVINLSLTPYAKIRIHAKNITPFDSSDKLNVLGSWSNAYYDMFGKNVDTSFSIKVIGNRNTTVHWYIRKNKIVTEHKKDIYCPAHAITDFEILYGI